MVYEYAGKIDKKILAGAIQESKPQTRGNIISYPDVTRLGVTCTRDNIYIFSQTLKVELHNYNYFFNSSYMSAYHLTVLNLQYTKFLILSGVIYIFECIGSKLLTANNNDIVNCLHS